MIATTDDPEELALTGELNTPLDISGGIEEDAALSLWQDEEAKRREESFKAIGQLYTDESAFEKFGMDPAIQAAQKWDLKPDLVKYGVLNRQFLSEVNGKPLEGLMYEKARADYAKTRWGLEEVDDQTFYKRAQQDFTVFNQSQTAQLDLQRDIIREKLTAAVEGRPADTTTVFDNWRATRQDIVADEAEGRFFSDAMRVATETAEKIGEYAPQAGLVFQTFEGMRAGTATSDDINELGKELARIPAADRQRLYQFAAVAASDLSEEQRANFGQVFENAARHLGRTMGEYGEALKLSPNLQTRELTISQQIRELESGAALPKKGQANLPYGMPELVEPLAAEERKAEIARLKEEREALQVIRELKGVFNSSVDPIRPVYNADGFFSAGTMEQGFYGITQSVPYILTAAVPFAGLPLNYVVMQDGLYNRMMLENPGMDPNVASFGAMLAAAPEAAIEKLQIEAFAGKMPLTARLFGGMQNRVTRILAKGVAAVGVQNVEEAMQDSIDAFVPTLMANLRDDMPDKDPYAVFDAYLDERPAVFWAMLIPGLAGGGFAARRDIKNLDSVLAPRVLEYSGYSEEQVATIRNAYDPVEAMRDTWEERTPENIAKGIAALNEDIDAAAEAQRDPLRPTMETVILPDGTKEWRILRSVPDEIDVEYLPDEELEGKTVTLQFTDADGRTTTQAFNAIDAQNRLKTNLDTYRQLIDCLGK